jgi:hypothetical protein
VQADRVQEKDSEQKEASSSVGESACLGLCHSQALKELWMLDGQLNDLQHRYSLVRGSNAIVMCMVIFAAHVNQSATCSLACVCHGMLRAKKAHTAGMHTSLISLIC